MFVCGRNPASASRKEKVKQQIEENVWLSRNNQINVCKSFDNDVGNCYHKDMKIRRDIVHCHDFDPVRRNVLSPNHFSQWLY